MFDFFKKYINIELTKNIKFDDLDKNFSIYKYLYDDLLSEDFASYGKYNFLNKDFENFVFQSLDYNCIYNILQDSILKNNLNENSCIINLASGDCKLLFFLKIFYNVKTLIGIENIFELYKLSKYILENKLKNKLNINNIDIYNKSIIDANINNVNLIIINYNNTEKYINLILQNKIEKECKKNTIIIKLVKPFITTLKLKLLKTKIIKSSDNKKIFVYYYLIN